MAPLLVAARPGRKTSRPPCDFSPRVEDPMTESHKTAVALVFVVALVAGFGLGVIGLVLYFIPGKSTRGQQFMRRGAEILLIAIFAGATFNVLFSEREGQIWGGIGAILTAVFISFGLPWLWKRFVRRQK